jgi:hypothetical protein
MHGGEHGASALAAALGNCKAYDALMGMRWCGLVDCRPMPLPERRKPRPDAIYKWLWRATEEGRRYLWRYGWVTGRLVPGTWSEDTYFGSADVCPCDALARDGAPSLLRPTALATAHLLWMLGPMTARQMAEMLGLSRGAVHLYLRTWARLGWVAQTETVWNAYWRLHPECHRAWQWKFTRTGLAGLERHAHAVRWAAQHSGYDVPADDRFYLNEDRTGWLVYDFTSDPS